MALALVLVLPRTSRTRLWALLLLVPAYLLAGRLLDVLYTVIG